MKRLKWVELKENEQLLEGIPVIKVDGKRFMGIETQEITPDPVPGTRTDKYRIEDKNEYWDYETICLSCEACFMAYDKEGQRVRNYCPCCGAKLE